LNCFFATLPRREREAKAIVVASHNAIAATILGIEKSKELCMSTRDPSFASEPIGAVAIALRQYLTDCS
jgi:hypothetical protein